jgi:hypothetical protein
MAKEWVRGKTRGAFSAAIKRLPSSWQSIATSFTESVVFRDEVAEYVGGSSDLVDHGEMGGLLDDDHTQYLKEKASGGVAAEVPTHTHADSANAGTVDHGALDGLSDDDHTQYLKEKASGGTAAEVPTHTHADAANAGTVSHTVLTDIGTNTHAQIDTHIGTSSIHFTRPSVVSKTTTYTAGDTEEIVLADATAGAFTVTLPTAASKSGFIYTVKKTDSSAAAVTIDGDGAETIDGDASVDLASQDKVISVVSDGSNWWIV